MKVFYIFVSLLLLSQPVCAFNPSASDVKNHIAGCSRHDGFDCMLLGEIYENGTEAISKDTSKAFMYYQKGCNFGENDACSALGYLYEMGVGTDADPKKALKLYTKSCEKDGVKGCFLLAKAFDAGALGLNTDPRKALEYFDKACGNDYADACKYAASHYETGTGTQKDLEKAKILYESGCLLGDDEACQKLSKDDLKKLLNESN